MNMAEFLVKVVRRVSSNQRRRRCTQSTCTGTFPLLGHRPPFREKQWVISTVYPGVAEFNMFVDFLILGHVFDCIFKNIQGLLTEIMFGQQKYHYDASTRTYQDSFRIKKKTSSFGN